MNIRQATQNYEAWLGSRIPLIPADITLKHQHGPKPIPIFSGDVLPLGPAMAGNLCGTASAPMVLSVGDLHVENFGTWRECGRPSDLGYQRFR